MQGRGRGGRRAEQADMRAGEPPPSPAPPPPHPRSPQSAPAPSPPISRRDAGRAGRAWRGSPASRGDARGTAKPQTPAKKRSARPSAASPHGSDWSAATVKAPKEVSGGLGPGSSFGSAAPCPGGPPAGDPSRYRSENGPEYARRIAGEAWHARTSLGASSAAAD